VFGEIVGGCDMDGISADLRTGIGRVARVGHAEPLVRRIPDAGAENKQGALCGHEWNLSAGREKVTRSRRRFNTVARTKVRGDACPVRPDAPVRSHAGWIRTETQITEAVATG
jgi:hypothetical protein